MKADRPQPLYSMAWLAVRADSAETVADAVGLRDRQPCNWYQGQQIVRRYGTAAFISPPVNGWVYIAGMLPYGALTYSSQDPFLAWMKETSATLGEVQFFSENNSAPFYTWALCRGGEIVRAYAMETDPLVRVLWNVGPTTEAERKANYDFGASKFEGIIPKGRLYDWMPYEQSTEAIAQGWGVCPRDIRPGDAEPGLGLMGSIRVPWKTNNYDYLSDEERAEIGEDYEEDDGYEYEDEELENMPAAERIAAMSDQLSEVPAEEFNALTNQLVQMMTAGEEEDPDPKVLEEIETEIRSIDTRHLLELYAEEKGFKISDPMLGRDLDTLEDLALAFVDVIAENLPFIPREAAEQMGGMTTGIAIKHYRDQVRKRNTD